MIFILFQYFSLFHSRNSLNRQCSIFSALGSVSVFASYAVWRQHSTTNFQVKTVVFHPPVDLVHVIRIP